MLNSVSIFPGPGHYAILTDNSVLTTFDCRVGLTIMFIKGQLKLVDSPNISLKKNLLFSER